MSQFREIWVKAIRANKELALGRPGAEREFDRLMREYPDDGMVFYERGEAFEYRHEVGRAEADYAAAERLFLVPHWQVVARMGRSRLHQQQQKFRESRMSQEPMTQWEAFHRVHTVPQAPHELRVHALSAIQRIDSEPGSAATDLRRCLEEVVQTKLNRMQHRPSGSFDLVAKIDFLKTAGAAPPHIAVRMHRLRQDGNQGAHGSAGRPQRTLNAILADFVAVLDWADSAVWHEAR